MTEITSNTPAEPVSTAETIEQLRSLVFGLGAMVLVLSLSFNIFIWKQNRNIDMAENARKQMVAQADGRVRELTQIANDLASYSAGKPELVAIFSRYGMELKQTSVTSGTEPR